MFSQSNKNKENSDSDTQKIGFLIRKSKRMVRFKKRPISNSLINKFYDTPEKFFTEYNKSLKYSSYFDICGNSIFMHYFYVLYEEYKLSNKKLAKNHIINNKILSNINIYKKHFDLFLQENKSNLFTQDINLETILHKIARLHDKTFFAKIIQKLKILGILNERVLSIKNIWNEACYDYIYGEINNKYAYYIYNDNEYNLIKNCLLIIKNENYSSFFDNLSIDKKMLINNFILKNNYLILKRPTFDSLYSNIDRILKNEREINIFEYIYNPSNSNINYLNILFNLCKSNEDFNILFSLIKQILNTEDYIPISNYEEFNRLFGPFSIGKFCFLNHLRYSLGKMNSSKEKGKYEINYCIQLIKNIFKNIINNKDESKIIDIVLYESKFLKIWRSTPRKSIINILLLNPNLNFDKKEEVLSILNEVTNGIIYKQIEEYFSIYVFF